MVYSSKRVADIFRNYYQELYAVNKEDAQQNRRRERNINYLKKAGLPRITDTAREILEAPISEEKIRKALLEAAPGKSPGPDGFTLFYYKKFK